MKDQSLPDAALTRDAFDRMYDTIRPTEVFTTCLSFDAAPDEVVELVKEVFRAVGRCIYMPHSERQYPIVSVATLTVQSKPVSVTFEIVRFGRCYCAATLTGLSRGAPRSERPGEKMALELRRRLLRQRS